MGGSDGTDGRIEWRERVNVQRRRLVRGGGRGARAWPDATLPRATCAADDVDDDYGPVSDS